ncbi:MAG: beta-ketoacyl-[acyl-carrier-protein] synthase family protein [Terriglobales bacterium]
MTPARCVVTGAGIISPLGTGMPANLDSLRRGAMGIVPIQSFPTQGFPISCAGEVRDPDIPAGAARMEAMAALVMEEAMAAAQLPAPVGPDPARAVSFAIGKATLELEPLAQRCAADAAALGSAGLDPDHLLRHYPELERHREYYDISAVLERLARRAQAGGARYSCYTACASGNDAIGMGMRLIERGEAEVVIAGGTDSQVHPLSMLEYEMLSALSREPAATACRPFDRKRSGFVVGEGAAALVLESADHARRRGAAVRAELAGFGSSMDAFGLTKCHPQGRGAAQAIQAALDDAGLEPRSIDYLNAHGTGTLLNDQAEAAAIHAIWGADTARLPVSSTKAMTGHLLIAASAVEAVFSLLALEEQLLPPNINYQNPDPECQLQLITQPGQHASLTTVMSNGFGFGGQNSSLILRRPPAPPIS